MKRLGALLLVSIMALSMLAGCGSTKTETAEGGLLNEGTLTVGMEIGYPPMEYFDEDGSTAIGFDVELAQALADDMGVKLELVDTAWDGIFAGVDTDKYDVIMSSVSFTEDRDENYLLSETYIANAPVLVVPKDSDITSIEETKGKTIAVQMETTADYIVQDYNEEGLGAELRQYEKVINAFDELKAGRVDSVCTDSVVAAYYLGDAAADYKTVWQSPTKEPIVMCMKKGNDTLKEKLEASLNNLRENGKLAEISTKYFGSDDPIK